MQVQSLQHEFDRSRHFGFTCRQAFYCFLEAFNLFDDCSVVCGFCGFADLDNDQDLDLVFAGDDVSYLNDGTGTFTQGPAIPVTGIDDPRAIAFADTDQDGDLDFAIGAKLSSNWLVRNNVGGANWLKVNLISPQGQRGAYGSKVTIYEDGVIGSPTIGCLLYTSPSPRDLSTSRMPSSA